MLLWGVATGLHVWVRARWQLYVLRVAIGCLEGRVSWSRLVDMTDLFSSWILPRHRVVPLIVLHAIRIRTTS
jgi:hypothetical protein